MKKKNTVANEAKGTRTLKTSAKKMLHCHVCKKSGFTTSYKLKTHLFLHKAISARYKCNYCAKEYYRSDEYARHMARHENNQKLHYCDHCDRSFVNKRNLISHLNIHDDLPNYLNVRFKCSVCDVSYCEDRLLKYHIRKAHLNLISTEPIHSKKELNETWIENVIQSKNCVQITKVKPNTLVIKRSKIKTAEKQKNKENDVFQQYINSVFAKKMDNYSKAICDYCGKGMLKKSIVGHIRERHLKIRRFRCEVCNKTFMRHYQLCLHECGKERRRRKVKN